MTKSAAEVDRESEAEARRFAETVIALADGRHRNGVSSAALVAGLEQALDDIREWHVCRATITGRPQ